MDLWWLLGGSYAVGLIASRVYEGFRGMPSALTADFLDVSHVLFGAIAIGAILAIATGSFTLALRQPAVADKAKWDSKPEDLNVRMSFRAFRVLRFFVVWLPIVLYPVAFYFFVLVLVMAGDVRGAGAFVGFFVAPVAILWAAEFISRPLDAWLREKPGIGDAALASIVGVEKPAAPSFHLARLIVVLSLLTVPWLYPRVSQSFGGGRPLPIRLQPDRTLLKPFGAASIGDTLLFLVAQNERFVAIARSDTLGAPIFLVWADSLLPFRTIPNGPFRFLRVGPQAP